MTSRLDFRRWASDERDIKIIYGLGDYGIRIPVSRGPQEVLRFPRQLSQLR